MVLPGFQSVATHHCMTGSMRHVYLFNQHDISEDMLLGLGNGVGFVYWHSKGTPPFFGGRHTDRTRPVEILLGERTGVVIKDHTSASASKAEATLLKMLDAGQPVMLQVDMGFLPYFDFGGSDYHFGGHFVVACGYDPDAHTVLIADRDLELHPVPLAALEQARGSTFQPFPPRRCWYSFDFSAKRQPTTDEIRQAIREQADLMLHPSIRNLGVAGIQKAGQMVPKWPDLMSESDLRMALFNTYIFISSIGGTGGGLFRYMFSRFLREAAQRLDSRVLDACADSFWQIGDRWEERGAWFKAASEAPDPAAYLGADLTRWFEDQAACEKVAWEQLAAAGW